VTVVIVRLIAVALSGLEVALLFVLGASTPADDLIWGDIGQWFISAACILGFTLVAALLFPRGGGLMLAVLGAAVLMILGISLTVRAGLLFGVPPLASGLLFIAAPRSQSAPGLFATLRARAGQSECHAQVCCNASQRSRSPFAPCQRVR
jgi:hypothetical protein